MGQNFKLFDLSYRLVYVHCLVQKNRNVMYYIYICKLLSPIITLEPLDQFASNLHK